MGNYYINSDDILNIARHYTSEELANLTQGTKWPFFKLEDIGFSGNSDTQYYFADVTNTSTWGQAVTSMDTFKSTSLNPRFGKINQCPILNNALGFTLDQNSDSIILKYSNSVLTITWNEGYPESSSTYTYNTPYIIVDLQGDGGRGGDYEQPLIGYNHGGGGGGSGAWLRLLVNTSSFHNISITHNDTGLTFNGMIGGVDVTTFYVGKGGDGQNGSEIDGESNYAQGGSGGTITCYSRSSLVDITSTFTGVIVADYKTGKAGGRGACSGGITFGSNGGGFASSAGTKHTLNCADLFGQEVYAYVGGNGYNYDSGAGGGGGGASIYGPGGGSSPTYAMSYAGAGCPGQKNSQGVEGSIPGPASVVIHV